MSRTKRVLLIPFEGAQSPPVSQVDVFVRKLNEDDILKRTYRFETSAISQPYHDGDERPICEMGIVMQQHGNPGNMTVLADPCLFEFIQVENKMPAPPSGCVPVHFNKNTDNLTDWAVDVERVRDALKRQVAQGHPDETIIQHGRQSAPCPLCCCQCESLRSWCCCQCESPCYSNDGMSPLEGERSSLLKTRSQAMT